MADTIKLEGQLEIDPDRGVIYFHDKSGYTALRICRLPIPIPQPKPGLGLDISHMHLCNWEGK